MTHMHTLMPLAGGIQDIVRDEFILAITENFISTQMLILEEFAHRHWDISCDQTCKEAGLSACPLQF